MTIASKRFCLYQRLNENSAGTCLVKCTRRSVRLGRENGHHQEARSLFGGYLFIKRTTEPFRISKNNKTSFSDGRLFTIIPLSIYHVKVPPGAISRAQSVASSSCNIFLLSKAVLFSFTPQQSLTILSRRRGRLIIFCSLVPG